jgi:hypothetical protein
MLLSAVLLALLLASCKSTPTPVEGAGEIPEFVLKARTAADDARTKAVEVKAAVASKELFAQAEAEYASGKEKETAKDYETAATGYTTAGGTFEKAYADALAKKEKALASMSAAENERKQSEEALKAADAEVAGTGTEGAAQ